MISLLINLLVICLIIGLGWWLLQVIPMPPPIKQVATVIFAVICVIILIYFLLGIVPAGGMRFGYR